MTMIANMFMMANVDNDDDDNDEKITFVLISLI